MKHIVIGTAGHIDHGKTTLIRALTGRNTDRLKEEQQRGITIELGFTWFDLDDGTRCGIVDVPGHEKFVGTMTAGVCGMDLVLMVVAADEGIMPQTREHLDILELLGVKKAILVLSKCDLEDEEWLDMAEAGIREELRGTMLEQAPLVRVSALTGFGIGHLKKTIAEMVDMEVEERDAAGVPRLPVDRIFTKTGFGTVVTGTLLSGSYSVDDVLEVYPEGMKCRIRHIQVHGAEQEQCVAGQRTALNLAGIRTEEIRRGSVLAPPGSMKASDRLDVRITILKNSERLLTNRMRLHFYTGTGKLLCRAVLLDRDELGPGETGFAQLQLEERIAVKRGDRFVIRFYSPVETIGGGVVLATGPKRRRRFKEEDLDELRRMENGSPADLCELQIRERGETLVSLTELAERTAHTKEELLPYLELLLAEKRIVSVALKKDSWYWHADSMFAAEQAISGELRRYHERHPYREGLRKAELVSRYMRKMKPNVSEACMELFGAEGIFRIRNGILSMPDFEIRRDARFLKIESALTGEMEKAGYHFLRLSEMNLTQYPEETVEDVLQQLVQDGTFVSLDEDVLTLKRLMDEAKEKIEKHFAENEILTFIQVREMLSTSRRCAKLAVGYMDRIKVTEKTGAETERVACR